VLAEFGDWHREMGYEFPTAEENPFLPLYLAGLNVFTEFMADDPTRVVVDALEAVWRFEMRPMEQPRVEHRPFFDHTVGDFLMFNLPPPLKLARNHPVSVVVAVGLELQTPVEEFQGNLASFRELLKQSPTWKVLGHKLRPTLSDNNHLLMDSLQLRNPFWGRNGIFLAVLALDLDGEVITAGLASVRIGRL